jgi:hypothetical protein
LRTNDGLLAHYISQEENISYQEANEAISLFVDDVFRKLALGEQIVIDEVGTLSMDLEKHIQFEPELNANFLLSSFGMTSIHSPAIKRDEANMEVVKGDNESVKKATKKRKKLWKIIELVPAAAVLAIMIFNPRVVHTLNNNLGNIISVPAPKEVYSDDSADVKKENSKTIEIPSETTATTLNTEPTVSLENDSFNQKMIEETAKALQDAFDKDVEAKTRAILAGETVSTIATPSAKSKITSPSTTIKETNTVVEKKNIPVVKEVKTTNKVDNNKEVQLKKYNVIGGVFSIKDNAYNYVKKAQADGYPAAIAGTNKRGHWVVSLASANSERELQSALDSIKAQYEQNAWVYKK